MKKWVLILAAGLIGPGLAMAEDTDQGATRVVDDSKPQESAEIHSDQKARETAGDSGTETTAPSDTMPDTASDSAPDSASDSTPDTMPDSTSDTATDTTPDSTPDTPSDTAQEDAPDVEPDPLALAAAACLDIAGAPNAGVPAAKVDAAMQKETLNRAAADCIAAASAETADPAVLFHAAAIAQSRGDATQTFELLTRAAEQGLGAAETRLGDYFLFGVGPRGQDIAEAVTHYQAATELGDAAGMTTLALLYQVARGVPRDTAKMVELMTGAADKGYHFAQYRLAQTYMRGEGVPGRVDTALGIPDPAKAVAYYTQAAEAGNLSAALELAALYDDPAAGLPDDPQAQVNLTRIVAQSGHPPAIARMGTFYEQGRGVLYSPSVAAKLYVQALETGKLDFTDLRIGAPRAWDRDTALEFQKILQERGLYDGALDAIVGPGTARAAAGLAAN